MKRLTLLAGIVLLAVSAGCQRQTADELTHEPSIYTPVRADEPLQEALSSPVKDYLTALETHDYALLMTCAADTLPLCRNETAFFEYTAGLDTARLEQIDWDTLTADGKDYLLRVFYTLDFTDRFTDLDGTLREPCTEEHIELFRLSNEAGIYYLTDQQMTGDE